MNQHQLVLEYVREFGSIVPAKVKGTSYKGDFFGSETPKRCRELYAKGVLGKEGIGRFKRFYLKIQPPEFNHPPVKITGHQGLLFRVYE